MCKHGAYSTALEKIYPHGAEAGGKWSTFHYLGLWLFIQSDVQTGRDSVSLLNGVLEEHKGIEPITFCLDDVMLYKMEEYF